MPKKQQQRVVVNMTRQKPKKKSQPTAVGKLIRMAGAAGGRMLGGYVGIPDTAAAAGRQLGALTSRWLGFGDYRVNKNTILNSSNGIPAMHNTSQTVVVRHKEYVGPINSSIDFKNRYELPLNPGLSGTFPWLSGIAKRYQEYAFKGVVFHYVPSSGTAVSGTNSALGTVMIQTSYRASDTAPYSKTEMMNEYCASESVPSGAFVHPIECDPKENPFNIHYVRSATPPTGEPLMSYDLGKTFVAVQGQQANDIILGDLWVTYEVELKKPVIVSDVIAPGYGFYSFSAPEATNLFAGTRAVDGPLKFTFDTNTITIPSHSPKQIMFTLMWRTGAPSAFDWNGAATVVNCKLIDCNLDGDNFQVSKVSSGAARPILTFIIERNNPALESKFTFSSVTWTGSVGPLSLTCVAVDAPQLTATS